MKVILALALFALVAQAVVLLPEDVPAENAPGQCPSGYPHDGLFDSCALNANSSWRIGSIRGVRDLTKVNSDDISFPEDFTVKPPGLDFVQSNDTNSCSIRLPGYTVLYQPMFNLKYAHYRIHACGIPWGISRCRIVIRDIYNRIVDWVDMRDEASLQCQSSLTPCQKTCNQGWISTSVAFYGVGDVIVKRAGDNDENNWVRFNDLQWGDLINVTAADFPLPNNDGNNTSNDTTTPDLLPEELEFVSGPLFNHRDVLSTKCNDGDLLPGNSFGANSQFKIISAATNDGDLCGSGLKQCPCEDTNRDPVCVYSDKGFVALPDQVYYLGLVSEECSCSFDNVCLSQVGGAQGYFGTDWVDTHDIFS